jgi:hypothetical protein
MPEAILERFGFGLKRLHSHFVCNRPLQLQPIATNKL